MKAFLLHLTHRFEHRTQAVPVYVGVSAWVMVLMGAFVVLAPSVNLFPAEGLYNGKRLLQLAVLGGVYAVFMVHVPTRLAWLAVYRGLSPSARVGLALVFGLGFVSAVWAPVPRYALLDVLFLVLLVGLTILVATLYRSFHTIADRVLVGIVLTAVALYVIRFAMGYVAYLTVGFGIWPKGGTGFEHIRFFNQFQTWTLPLLVLPLLMKGTGQAIKVLSGSVAVVWWSLLIASGGRGTTLAVGAAAVVVALIFRKQAWSWLRVQGLVLIGGVLCYLLLFVALGETDASLTQRTLASDSERFILWNDAVAMVEQAPWLGVGPMHYAYYHPSDLNAHPHNAVLQFASEWGLPATILLVGLVFWGLGSWLRGSWQETQSVLRQHQKTALRVAVTAALLAGGGHALLSGMLVMPLPQMLLVLVVGWAWGMHITHKPLPKRPTGIQRKLVVVVFLSALSIVAWSIKDDIGAAAQAERFEVYEPLPERSVRYPRFWQIGYIW